MPAQLAPMLATAGELPPDEGWAFEIKWDGVRALAYLDAGSLRLESRNRRDITPRYPELVPLPPAVAERRVVLDGEVVAFDERGLPSFGRLQHRMHLADAGEVRRQMAENPIAYMVFDVLWLDGESLTALAYDDRRAVLEGLDLVAGPWQVPTSHRGDGAALLDAARRSGLEGVVAKRRASNYEAGRRSTAWRKVKLQSRQELVVGGWLPGAGNRSGRIGALLVGHYDGRFEGAPLRYAGRVGTGFSDNTLRELAALLEPLAIEASPFVDAPRERRSQWVQPTLVAEVEFTEWTAGGTLRHPSFKGLRTDKVATDVVREPRLGEH